MKTKKVILSMLVIFLFGLSTAGITYGKNISIVSTTFPQYDWVREVLGEEIENVELTLLMDTGVDLHSYQPTVEDIAKMLLADLFLYVGGESDAWVERALALTTNRDIVTINLMEVLGDRVKREEIVEGMEHSHDHDHHHDHDHDDHDHHHDHDHDHDHHHDHDHAHEHEWDEHVWLSLRHAQTITSQIAEDLGRIDPENAALYRANAAAYNRKLAALDAEYQNVVDAAPQRILLFGDRFPFRYLVDDYDIQYFAAFSGCSAETEASFETVIFLANQTAALQLQYVMVIENSNQSVAETIIQSTPQKNQSILVLDSMQSVTAQDVAAGKTYLSIMRENLEVLKKALY